MNRVWIIIYILGKEHECGNEIGDSHQSNCVAENCDTKDNNSIISNNLSTNSRSGKSTDKMILKSFREDAHKKSVILVVGPLRGGGDPPYHTEKNTLFSMVKKKLPELHDTRSTEKEVINNFIPRVGTLLSLLDTAWNPLCQSFLF